MDDVTKSRRGYYYDLEKSPYVFHTQYGDSFKFPSAKKLEMYTRDVKIEIERINRVFERGDLIQTIPKEVIDLIYRYAHIAVYRRFTE